MTVLDPGHDYVLDSLDGDAPQRLTFVKREGAKYPGNKGSHPGTTIQEVLRALIERCRYVNAQTPCHETPQAAARLIDALVLLERRAARLHGRSVDGLPLEEFISGAGKCPACGHVGCGGTCRDRLARVEPAEGADHA